MADLLRPSSDGFWGASWTVSLGAAERDRDQLPECSGVSMGVGIAACHRRRTATQSPHLRQIWALPPASACSFFTSKRRPQHEQCAVAVLGGLLRLVPLLRRSSVMRQCRTHAAIGVQTLGVSHVLDVRMWQISDGPQAAGSRVRPVSRSISSSSARSASSCSRARTSARFCSRTSVTCVQGV